jgi:hypothetical protein
VLNWSDRLLAALLRGLIDGDGVTRKDDGRKSFIQKKSQTMEVTQAAGVLLGYASKLTEWPGMGISHLFFTNKRYLTLRGTNGKGSDIKLLPYTGVVWCPKLSKSTWVARRKGRVFFTGNSFPAALVERPVAMTCPEWVTEKGPRVRIVEMTEYDEKRGSKRIFGQYSLADEELLRKDESTLTDDEKIRLDELRKKSGRMDTARTYTPKYPKTLGWTFADIPARPGVVLDPFGGTGTTGEVAIKLSRRFIGIDLYPNVADRMRKRCEDSNEGKNRMA